jgi:hypothetical protein
LKLSFVYHLCIYKRCGANEAPEDEVKLGKELGASRLLHLGVLEYVRIKSEKHRSQFRGSTSLG